MAVVAATPSLSWQPELSRRSALWPPFVDFGDSRNRGRSTSSTRLVVAAGCFLLARRQTEFPSRSRVCLLADPNDDTRKLWQEAYAIEIERAERLQSGALPKAPESSAPATEWQAAYEALKVRTTDVILDS